MHHHDHGASSSADSAEATPARARSHRRRLAIACAVTVGIVLAQAVGAWVTGSLALLTDAVHSLTDSIGLGVALLAAGLMYRAATAQRTWGFRRVEILAGLLQAALLLSVGIYAAVEGVGRLNAPPVILHMELLIFAAAGLAGNLISLFVLASGRKANLNMRAAFLEVSADALGSLSVMAAAIVIWATGWQQADAVAALAIAALIIPRALLLLRETARVLLEFAPRGLDLEKVRSHMLAQDHVQDVHDLHASTVATGLPVISAHVVLDDACFREGCVPETLTRLKTCVAEHFDVAVEHSTFQLEPSSIAAGETHTHA